MKITYLFALLFLLSFKTLYSQESRFIDTTKICCTYKYEFLEDSTSRNTKKTQFMILQIGSSISKFSSRTQIRRDSLQKYSTNEDAQVKMNRLLEITRIEPINPLCSYTVIKNYPSKNTVNLYANLNRTSYCVPENSKLKWVIDSEKDTVILGLKCNKAYTSFAGRNYSAWFTTEIPISEGPYIFSGLPGLILKISDLKHQHVFTIASIEKPKFKQPIIFQNAKTIEASPAEYVKALNANNARLLGEVQSGGKINFNDEESKAKSIQKLKSRNNFIERY